MKKKAAYKKSNISNDILQRHSVSLLSIFSFVILWLFIAPFHKALFIGANSNTVTGFVFNQPLYLTIVFGALAMLFFVVYAFKYITFSEKKDVLHLLIWLIPLSFLLSKITAVSASHSTNHLFIVMFYAFIFIFGAYLARDQWAYRLQTAILGSGAVIIIFGLMNWLGDASLFGLISYDNSNPNMYRDAVLIDSNGERLTSVFQYANTYAAYLIAMILAFLFTIVNTRHKASVILMSVLLVPALVSFALTLSRGGIVVLPFVMLLVLPLLRVVNQLWMIVYLAISGAASLLILNVVTDWGIQLQSDYSTALNLKAWLALSGVSIVTAGVIYGLQLYIAPILQAKWGKLNQSKWSHLVLPVLGIVLGSALVGLLFSGTGMTNLLPEQIKTRVESINLQQHSVLERATFYRDAAKVIQDYPVTGAGGGAWSQLYEKYQNNPYTSRQAHNFFLQYFIEVGLVGFIIFTVLLIGLFYLFLRHYYRQEDDHRRRYALYYIVVVSILVHSMIDFNMSYAYVAALVFLCLGGMLAGVDQKPFEHQWKWGRKPGGILRYYPGWITVMAIVTLIVSSVMLNASNHYETAIHKANQNKPYQDMMHSIDKALQLREYPDYVIFKIDLLKNAYTQTQDEQYRTEAMDLIKQLNAREPFNRPLFEQEYALHIQENDYESALELVESKLDMYIWDISIYARAMTLNYELGGQDINSIAREEVSPYWQRAVEIYSMAEAKVAELDKLPEGQLQGRPFSFTPEMATMAAHIYYTQEKFAEAEQAAKPHIREDFNDANALFLQRIYAAALHQQNKPLPAAYEAFMEANAEEQAAFRALVN